MKNRKRLLVTAISMAMMFQGLPEMFNNINAYAEVIDNGNISSVKGNIDVILRFDNNETIEELENRNIKLEVFNSSKNLVDSITLNSSQIKYNDDGSLNNWETTFELGGGSSQDIYTIKFVGVGHRDFVVPNIDLSLSSKSITVGTGDGTFAYGDLDNDGFIDENDVKIIEEIIREQEVTGEQENKVTLIDYTKIVSLVKKIEKQDLKGTESLITSTSYVNISDIVEFTQADVQALEEVAKIEGDLSNVLNSGNTEPVTITPKDGTTELTIPITVGNGEGAELSEVQIEGSITSGVATVAYIDDNGDDQIMYVNFGDAGNEVSAISTLSVAPISIAEDPTINVSNEIATITEEAETNTVVISLGTRVVVKKISVTVELDEDNNYVVLQEVTFVQDIVPENPYSSDGLIENLKAIGGDKTVSLTWDKAENVGGYKVSYGESSGRYTNFSETTTNSITISLSENLVNNYFVVQSTYGDWLGSYSSEVLAMGIPSSVPSAPTSISVTEDDRALKLSWTAGKDALTHNVYIREQGEEEYTKLASGLTSCSYNIGSLDNGTTYEIVISGTNSRGEGAKSSIAEGTPFKDIIDGPILPTHNRMPNSNITSVGMRDSTNYDSSIYPNGYSPDFIWDEDYGTYWQSKTWYGNANFDINFDEPMTMDYVIWVPCVDSSAYATALAEYNITVQTVENPTSETIVYNTAYTYNETVDVYYDENNKAYCVLPFPKTENITQLTVGVWIKDGGARSATLSEIACYEYDSIEEDISALFSNNIKTELAKDVTLSRIEELEERLHEIPDFVIRTSILEAELELAKSLLSGDETALGYVKDDFVLIDTSNDLGTKGSSISPLGWVSFARYDSVVYADIPEGETLTIYPSQFYNSSGEPYSTANAIELKNGRNIVTTPDLTNISGLVEGGQWYYSYSGDNIEDVTMHFFKDIGIYQGVDYLSDCVVTPVLEIYDYDLQDDEDIVMEKMVKYVEDLDAYTSSVAVNSSHPNYNNFNWSTNEGNNPLNTTEISLRHTLLSLTVTGVNSALGSGTVEERAEKLYNSALSWEQINYVTNRVYGDNIVDGISTRNGRQNVRVMRMSASAFMYAGGNHIGIQYGSASSMLPTSSNIHPNNLGWGIAHEIGHNLDRIGILEVTNNIYSMAVATYSEDGTYTPLNRIPWTTVFNKVSSGATGSSADIFAQLGMYWQLHLAYADSSDVLDYYSSLFGAYNIGEYTGSNKFEVLASQKANKDLTDFFTAWGTQLSEEAKTEMAKLPKEDREIQYLNEDSLKLRFEGETGLSSGITFDVTSEIKEDDDQTVILTADYNGDMTLVQGFEVYRDGVLIGFTTNGVYEDYFGSMNNKSIEYDMRMIDKLGNVVSEKMSAPQVRVEYDNVIDRSDYTVAEVENGLKITFDDLNSVSGFRIADNFPTSGDFEVQVGIYEYDEYGDVIENSEINYVTVRSNDFSKNEVDSTEKFISYFQKQGVDSDDTRIGTYDAKEIIITGDNVQDYKDNLDIISYVGDKVSFTNYVMGRLYHDFDAGGDILEAGTIIVVGDYVGDPYFNEITITGRYIETDIDGNSTSLDIAMAGDTYMFATVPEGGVVSTISDGLFIFVPSVQNDHTHDDSATDCDHSSLFPAYMKAVMNRNDSSGNGRTTSYTSWEFVPSFDTIPDIVIE